MHVMFNGMFRESNKTKTQKKIIPKFFFGGRGKKDGDKIR